MPPPPVTPSPHRFVIKKPAPIRKTPLAQDATPRPSTQQFKTTPRFAVSSTPRPTPTQNLPASTPSATRFATPAWQIQTHEDVIENIESSFEGPIHDSIETDNHNIELGDLSGDEEYKIEERNPKRRRLSSSSELLLDEQKPEDNECPDSLSDSSLPILSSPPTARRPLSTAASRFLVSTPAPSSTPQDTQAFLKPPRFRPPDPSEQTRIDPLPEQFSPHRRGQKYLAGGLAAEVRDWLVNLESAIPVQRAKDDPFIVRVLADEVSGNGRAGMTLVRGRKIHSEGTVDSLGLMKVILAGEGTGTDLQRPSVAEAEKTVGIKGPVWEVVLEGEKWGVGVDWKVLS